jgi:hypothetical protein
MLYQVSIQVLLFLVTQTDVSFEQPRAFKKEDDVKK